MDLFIISTGFIGALLTIIGFFSPWIRMEGVVPGVPKEVIKIMGGISGWDMSKGNIILKIIITGGVAEGGIQIGGVTYLSLIIASALLMLIGSLFLLIGRREFSIYLLVGGLLTILLTGGIMISVQSGEKMMKLEAFTIKNFIEHGYGLYLSLAGGVISLSGISIYIYKEYGLSIGKIISGKKKVMPKVLAILIIILFSIPSISPLVKTRSLEGPWKGLNKLLYPLWNIPVVNAVTGHGRLTVGVGGNGVITNLDWPSPSYNDQVNYYATNNSEELLNKGVFIGLYIKTREGDKLTWVRRPEWIVNQRYADSESTNIVTDLIHPKWGIRVRIIDSVHPQYDIFSRHVIILDPGEAEYIYIIFYNNFAPTTYHIPRLPSIADALMDEYGDFATLYIKDYNITLHFMPNKVGGASEKLRKLVEENNGDIDIDKLENTLGEGVYLAVGLSTPLTGYQVGNTLSNPEEAKHPQGQNRFIDPYLDAVDGVLTGNTWAIGQTAAALMTKIDREVTLYITPGKTPSEAIKLLQIARSLGAEAIEKASDDSWKPILKRAKWPQFPDKRARDIAERTLLLLLTCRDRETGAVVAAPTTQSPYRQD